MDLSKTHQNHSKYYDNGTFLKYGTLYRSIHELEIKFVFVEHDYEGSGGVLSAYEFPSKGSQSNQVDIQIYVRQTVRHTWHICSCKGQRQQKKTTLLLWLPGIASYLRSVDVCHSKTKVMESDKQRAQQPVSAISADFQAKFTEQPD